MEILIRKSGNGVDLIIEVTTINPSTGNGIPATITASIQRMSGSNFYWDSLSEAFDDVAEPALDALTHVSKGLHQFTLVGGAELIYQPYRIHVLITGNPDINTDALFSDNILAEAPTPSDATLANQNTIISNQSNQALDSTVAKDLTVAKEATVAALNNISVVDVDTELTANHGAGAWITAITAGDITSILGTPLTEGGVGRLAAAFTKFLDLGTAARTLNDIGDLKTIEGSPTIDGKTITLWYKIMLAYTTGRMKINFPNPGDITFYEQDNITVVFVMHVNTIERTRL